jgi:hypothetical protein
MNWGTRGAKFATKRVAIPVFAMVRFGVRVRCGAHVLEIRFRQRRLVWRQCVLCTAAAAEENKRDERRENG